MNARFTGTLGGGGQNVFNSTAAQKDDPFGAGTAVPKPNSARRLGTSFTGGIARPQPRAAGTDPSFGSINLTNKRQTFGRLGERAANQDIDNFNAKVTSENDAATAAKQAEIGTYNAEVDRLTGDYNTLLDDYNTQWGKYNTDVDGYGRLQTDIGSLNDRYTNYQFYDEIVNGPNVKNLSRSFYTPYFTQNRDLFNSYQSTLTNQNPEFSHMFTGTFTDSSLIEPTIQQPNQPVLPDAPDPFVALQQTKNRLGDPAERRLLSSQREIVGGDLPPQEATSSGDTFSQLDVPFRDLSELNAAEKKSLGLPKAYKFATGFSAQSGNNNSFGGQTFTPDDIGNQNDTHFYFKNFGWVAKSQLTPLY